MNDATMLQLLITVLISMSTGVFSGDSEDFILSGCFSTTFSSRSDYGTVIKPLTWQMCVQLCKHKVTVYAGVQSSKHTCFCGNDMRQYSALEDDSHCHTCQEDNSRWCGGNETLSIYQVRSKDSVPLALLVATENGMKMIIHDNDSEKSLEVLELSNGVITSVDYHYKKHEIFFVSKNKIYKSAYIPTIMKYIHDIAVSGPDCVNINDLAVDWVQDQFSVPCESTGEENGYILDGPGRFLLVNKAEQLSHFYLEPLKRIFFFIENMRLGKCKSECKTKILSKYLIEKTVELSVDIQQEAVYVIASYNYEKKFLVSCNYEGSSFRVIYDGPELYDPHGLSTVDGWVVWSNKVEENYTIYKGHVSSRGVLEKLTAIYTGTQEIHDLKIFSQEAQSPGSEYLCQKQHCSHGCKIVSRLLAECTCPTDMTLADDRTTCEVTTKRTSISETSTFEISSFEASHTSTQDYSTLETVENTGSETETSSEVSNSTTYQTTTQTPKEIQFQEYHYHFIFVLATMILIIVFVIPFQIIIAYWLQKTNSTLRFNTSYNKTSELVELTYNS